MEAGNDSVATSAPEEQKQVQEEPDVNFFKTSGTE